MPLTASLTFMKSPDVIYLKKAIYRRKLLCHPEEPGREREIAV
jgi:hypothetical protein